MRTVTFADARVVDLLNEGYVVVWNNHSFDRRAQGQQPLYSTEEMAAYPEGGGGINLYTVIAAPDGTVLNVLTGYWSPETLLDELQFCRGLTPENRAVRQAERKNALRKQLSRMRETFPDEMGKRPKDSAVVRRMAALELLSQSHDQYSMSIPMGGIDEYLAAVAQRSKPRVIS